MPYDEFLADRLRRHFTERSVATVEKKMMGGLTFMVDDKMCLGLLKSDLMVRIDPGEQEQVLARPGCREMDFTKRPMRGFVFVSAEGTDRESDLAYWVDKALAYNKIAKPSKAKK
jgi:hypothetical protein